MNFNFKEILEMFSGHWKFIAFLILVTATLTGFVVVPVAQSYFGSERQSCGKCLEENDKLLDRIMEISALVREYEYGKAMETKMVEAEVEEDTIKIPIPENNNQHEAIIEKIGKLTTLQD